MWGRRAQTWFVFVAYVLVGAVQLFHGLELRAQERDLTAGPSVHSACSRDCSVPSHDHRAPHDHAACQVCRVAGLPAVTWQMAPRLVTEASAVFRVVSTGGLAPTRPTLTTLLARAPPLASIDAASL